MILDFVKNIKDYKCFNHLNFKVVNIGEFLWQKKKGNLKKELKKPVKL